MKENVIVDKSYAFALRIIKMYQYLVTEKKEYALAKQVLRCGTSIGANVEEAQGGQSRKDFLSKMAIAYKEARGKRPRTTHRVEPGCYSAGRWPQHDGLSC